MPKFKRKKYSYVPYDQPILAPGYAMNTHIMPPMFSIPPPPPPPSAALNYNPSLYVPQKVNPQPPSSQSSKKSVDFRSRTERACLPFFKEELIKTQPRDPTDVVIIDFDRTLLSTPEVSPDLFSRESRQTLKFRLGSGFGWLQSPDVLKAAVDAANWDENLLEIARDASNNDSVVLVITTARLSSDISPIRAALQTQGVHQVDHFACSTGLDQQEDDEEEDEHDGISVSLNGWAKQHMLELLLESYDTMERMIIFDSNLGDRRKYRQAISYFVRDGWLNAEAVYIADLMPKQTQLGSLLDQRQLVERVVKASNSQVEKTVLVVEWLHKVTTKVRRDLAVRLVELIGDGVIEKLFLEDVSFTKGRLSPELRALVTQKGRDWHWRIVGYKVENRIMWLKLDEGTGTDFLKAARLAKGVQDAVVDFIGNNHIASEGTGNSTTMNTSLPDLQSLHDLKIETYLYERRELRVQRKRP